MQKSLLRVATLVLLAFGASCSTLSPPLVETRTFEGHGEPLTRLAVLPFYPEGGLSRSTAGTATSSWEAATLVTRFVTDAISHRGVDVIPESDVQLAFASGGHVTPRAEPRVAAELAATQFGASAVLLGEVRRYRERSGSSYGSEKTSSVSFQVTLYEAPTGKKIFEATFDQTQPSLTENVFTALRYPRWGSRFLTVAELARFGAERVAAELPLDGVAPGKR